MSCRAQSWAWKQTCPNPTQKLVLLALAEHADTAGYAFPGTTTLADRCGIHPRSVKRHLRELAHAELVDVQERHDARGRQTSNGYQLHIDRAVEDVDNPVENRGEGDTSVRGEGDTGVTPTTLNLPEGTVQLTISSFQSEIGEGSPNGSSRRDRTPERVPRWLLFLQRRLGRLDRPSESEARSDAQIIRRQLERGCDPNDLADAIRGIRQAADEGALRGFVERGEGFAMKVLNQERHGRPLWRWAADRYRKSQEGPALVGDVLEALMSRRQARREERPRRESGPGRSGRSRHA